MIMDNANASSTEENTKQLDAQIAAQVARDHAWLPHDRHGRYLRAALDAGAGPRTAQESVVKESSEGATTADHGTEWLLG
jgi:hypothetical protein